MYDIFYIFINQKAALNIFYAVQKYHPTDIKTIIIMP
jgi:hypothetical protein